MDPIVPFWAAVAWHLVRYALRLYGSWKFNPIPVPDNPQIRPESVSVIIATIDVSEELIPRLQKMLDNEPKEIIIVTSAKLLGGLNGILKEYLPQERSAKIRALDIPRANKRNQLARGIQAATGEIIALADDDVYWTSNLLSQVLAAIESNPKIGGVTTLEESHGTDHRSPETITVWEAFEARRLHQRNINITASAWLDGSVTVLSGRTSVYRACILKDPAFLYGLTNEYWLWTVHMHCGDDQFITRWLLNHDWEVTVQAGATIYCEGLHDSRHVKQILRWSRNARISSVKRVVASKQVWRYPWLSTHTTLHTYGAVRNLWRLWLLASFCFNPTYATLVEIFLPR
ncbi:hypothetical protein FE257_001284 [Aspergillus nanangensis]|uniref:Uncharacterized protein n=1 Tax=Aspergillus nanangensis TaxID=2582783 RepID=A0AAD4CED6_ASPNN|nr:hypothetical protein FE257_001284 [Aspergillus nanangensis]